jgi:uncharacterized surface protein with fasciclin (FAS1) repeats
MAKCTFGLAVLAAAAFLTPGAAEEKKDVVDTAAEGGQFQTFTTAVKEAGLTDTLRGKGPFTVLVPTDAAFQKLPEDTMKAILTDKEKLKKLVMAHVVAGKELRAADVARMSGQKLNGFAVKAEADKVTVGKATLDKADIRCSNGVLHVIDAVLVPE